MFMGQRIWFVASWAIFEQVGYRTGLGLPRLAGARGPMNSASVAHRPRGGCRKACPQCRGRKFIGKLRRWPKLLPWVLAICAQVVMFVRCRFSILNDPLMLGAQG